MFFRPSYKDQSADTLENVNFDPNLTNEKVSSNLNQNLEKILYCRYKNSPTFIITVREKAIAQEVIERSLIFLPKNIRDLGITSLGLYCTNEVNVMEEFPFTQRLPRNSISSPYIISVRQDYDITIVVKENIPDDNLEYDAIVNFKNQFELDSFLQGQLGLLEIEKKNEDIHRRKKQKGRIRLIEELQDNGVYLLI
ncbi:hypothetical protein HK099_008482 [Clydaea vesicula]|uniref:Uncharacterized protein n=1 Tax=Clydaea vesicula TaxID=447962 RepID=A0AAD5TXC8_9FUNG|nr:hypothetical protein HK099_008482 [Clydaea vesicula]KAJ3382510.1 hypothetical protein HDU92_004740 [Lobulomyces angularis]